MVAVQLEGAAHRQEFGGKIQKEMEGAVWSSKFSLAPDVPELIILPIVLQSVIPQTLSYGKGKSITG